MSISELKVSQLLKILKDNGYKYTDKRKSMIELFVKEDRYISAKYISEKLSVEYPGFSFDTVYKNLATYTNLGILELTEINGERHYKLSCLKHDHHHHHHICLKCGKAKIINYDLCNNLNIPGLEGYKITDHKFEIYGYCPKCLKEDNKLC